MRHAENFSNLRPDGFRVGHPARPEFAAGHRAYIRFHHPHACLPQPCDVALGGIMLPHPHIHGRHSHHRLVSRQNQRGRQIIGNARCHLGQQIRRCGADHHQISLPAQLDMAHLGFVLQIPQCGVHRVFTQRGQRHGGDKLLAAGSHHAGDIAASLADQPHQLARFIGGNTAPHHQQDTRRSPRAHLAILAMTAARRRGDSMAGLPNVSSTQPA